MHIEDIAIFFLRKSTLSFVNLCPMLQGGTELFNKSVYNIKNVRKSL